MKISVKKFLVTISMCALLFAVTALAGCGETVQPTLEDIAAENNDVVKTIRNEIETPEGMTVEIAFSGDSFDINYRYEEPLESDEEDALTDAYAKNDDELKSDCETAIAELQKETGITGITGTIHIINASGNETWSLKFPEEE